MPLLYWVLFVFFQNGVDSISRSLKERRYVKSSSRVLYHRSRGHGAGSLKWRRRLNMHMEGAYS
jgi:hypothetical protein